MKQPDKKALLTKLLQGEITTSAVKRLVESELKPLIIVFRHHSRTLQPTDEVIVRQGREDITIPYGELEEYARRVGGIVVVKVPDNERERKNV